MFGNREHAFHCYLENKDVFSSSKSRQVNCEDQKTQMEVLLHDQNRNYFLVSKIAPKQAGKNYHRMSAESINTFIFTRLGTFTHVQTHVKRTTASLFCFVSNFLQNHLLGSELFSENSWKNNTLGPILHSDSFKSIFKE